jgi:hypothetical protein
MPPLAYEIGLRPWEWWRLTPREFGDMVEGYVAAERRRDYRAAVVVSAIYNTVRDPRKRRRPFTPEDFLRGEKPARRVQAPEEMLEVVKRLQAAFGGELR